MVSNRVVDIGQIGDLVGHFLWLLTKDFFVCTKVAIINGMGGLEFEHVLRDCQLVPVVEFLKFVLGQKSGKQHHMLRRSFIMPIFISPAGF